MARHADSLAAAPEASSRLFNEAGLHLRIRAEFDPARDCFERAIRIDEPAYGPDHPSVAIRVNNLGTVLEDQGDLDGAKKCYERAFATFRKFLGDGHPNTRTVAVSLAFVRAQLGEP